MTFTLTIEGHQLPGRDCGPHRDVHVALQVGRDPVDMVPGDAETATWTIEIETLTRDDNSVDFRGPGVQGMRGGRFVYLTWGEVKDTEFAMFRRAKLMLDDVPKDALAGQVTARVHLTDECGLPRCARLRPPALEFSSAPHPTSCGPVAGR